MPKMWELRPEDSVAQSREVPMKRALGMGLFAAVVAGFSGAAMLGWAYEGPRRFFRRVRLRKALR